MPSMSEEEILVVVVILLGLVGMEMLPKLLNLVKNRRDTKKEQKISKKG